MTTYERTPTDITIFSLLAAVSIFILLWGVVFYSLKYKKEKKEVLTLKKIVIFSLFFSIFIGQALFTRFLAPGGSPVIPFSLDTITIIAVGFIFGPIEGIVYAVTADLTRVGINGWVPQLLPALSAAILGLMSGAMGRLYFKKGDDMNDIWAFFGMQAIIVFFAAAAAIAAPVLEIVAPNTNSEVTYYSIMGAAIASLIFMELLLLYARRSENRNSMRLIVFLTLINTVDRVYSGYIIRSFSQYWYWGFPFSTQLLQRMITASYLVPARTIASVALIKATLFAIEQRGGIKNWVS